MPQWMQDLFTGWPMIRANLPTFFVLAVLIIVAVWWLMDWRYGGIITNKDSEITLLKGQRDDYKDKLSGATPDQAKARIDALEARLAIVEGRRLTDKQIELLRTHLGSLANVSVSIASEGPCSDCNVYSEDLANFFNGLPGWTVTKSMFVGAARNARTGFGLRAQDINLPNTQTALLAQALTTAKIPFEFIPIAFGDALIQIQINSRLTR